jgi:hypothetical protein
VNQPQALAVILVLGMASARVSKRYLDRGARLTVAGIALIGSVLTLVNESS